MTTLSSYLPRPVSSHAAFARAAPFSRIVARIASMTFARTRSGSATNRGWAFRAASTAAFTVGWIPIGTAGAAPAGSSR